MIGNEILVIIEYDIEVREIIKLIMISMEEYITRERIYEESEIRDDRVIFDSL